MLIIFAFILNNCGSPPPRYMIGVVPTLDGLPVMDVGGFFSNEEAHKKGTQHCPVLNFITLTDESDLYFFHCGPYKGYTFGAVVLLPTESDPTQTSVNLFALKDNGSLTTMTAQILYGDESWDISSTPQGSMTVVVPHEVDDDFLVQMSGDCQIMSPAPVMVFVCGSSKPFEPILPQKNLDDLDRIEI